MLAGTSSVVADDENSKHGNRHQRGARASAVGMTLYEVTESLAGDPFLTGSRDAEAMLLGFAKLGTPLCPLEEVLLSDPQAETCTILGKGSDKVSLSNPSRGTVKADLTVVVNSPINSSVHVPDLPTKITGAFQGTIDLSLAFARIPLGKINPDPSNVITINGKKVPISATFRMPFALDRKGHPKRVDDEEEQAFYLADDLVSLIEVQPHERNLGFPTVRVEVDFLQ
jgi:hypothetical protein